MRDGGSIRGVRRRAAAVVRGFTLVETLVAVSTTSLILASVAVAISSLHRVNRRLRDEFPNSSAMARFENRWRSDVHRASRAEIVSQPSTTILRLTLPQQRTVEYWESEQRVIRTDQAVGQPAQRDTFPIPRDGQIEWSVVSDPGPLVQLTLRYPVGGAAAVAKDYRVTRVLAAIGVERDGSVRP